MTELNDSHADEKVEGATVSPAEVRRVIEAEELLCGEQEILIRNGKDVYRLRKTRLGKLILCK